MEKKKNRIPERILPSQCGSTALIRTDPQGSYTGCPENREEIPVQDADDL